MRGFYGEVILDHYRFPRNRGKIARADFHAEEENDFCGDMVEVSGIVKKGKIKEIKFRGKGCVISQAAASLLTCYAAKKSAAQIKKMGAEDMQKLLGINLSLTRLKCAELSLITLKKALALKK